MLRQLLAIVVAIVVVDAAEPRHLALQSHLQHRHEHVQNSSHSQPSSATTTTTPATAATAATFTTEAITTEAAEATAQGGVVLDFFAYDGDGLTPARKRWRAAISELQVSCRCCCCCCCLAASF